MRYLAIVRREGRYETAEFPDCPGCQTFAEAPDDLAVAAAEALAGWLETSLAHGDAPAPPSRRYRKKRGDRLLWVEVPPKLTAAIEVRWARTEAKLTQAGLGKLIGVSQQQVAKMERATANVSLDTLQRVAHALGRTVRVELVRAG
ncbi:MAG: helix-turn-helix transcriptional regulator [Gemmatimonadales bacterium]